MSSKKLQIDVEDDTLVMIVNYKRQTVELLNGDGKPLHVEGEIDKDKDVMRINIRVETKDS